MGFNEFLSSIFGNKSTRDMKEIKPWVEKIKAAYPEIEALDNDALRAKTEELKKYIRESATDERAKVEELKASIESTELEDREEVFAQIDKIEKEILDKYEKALDEVLPVAFSIVKATAKRFTENEEIVVTATDFDRQLAATKDFVRIEGDKAISGIGHFITLFLQEAFQKHGILQVIVSKKNFQWFHELLFIFSISICADYCGMVISTVVPLPI